MNYEVVFYLFISMAGVDSSKPFGAGEYPSIQSCHAIGSKIVKDINTSHDIVRQNKSLADTQQISAEYECRTSKPTAV